MNTPMSLSKCLEDFVKFADSNVGRTLAGMFPDLDRDVIDDVVGQKQGR